MKAPALSWSFFVLSINRIQLVFFPVMNLTTIVDTTHIEKCSVPHGTSESIIQFPSNTYVISQVIVCFVTAILVVSAVLLNSVSISTILKCSQLKEKVCYQLILVQSVVDLCIVFVSAPLYMYIEASEVLGTAKCVVNFFVKLFAMLPLCLSPATLCALSLERYLAVLHPFFHRSRNARRFLLMSMCCHCGVILICFAFMLIYREAYYVLVTGNVSLSLTFQAFVYTRIFLAIRKRFRLENRPGDGMAKETMADSRCFLKEMKLAKSCFLVLLAFVFCSIPVVVVSAYSGRLDILLFRVLQSWAVAIGFSNSSLNCIIFFWSRPLLKNEAKRILKAIQG